MSFSYNPWQRFEIVNDDSQSYFRWKCGGCGTESKQTFTIHTALGVLRESYNDHLKMSHGRIKDDFDDWANERADGYEGVHEDYTFPGSDNPNVD